MNKNETSLKTILESSAILKVFFDIRNDSDVLFSLFQISVDGIKDLQLMKLATQTGLQEFVAGLATCIKQKSPISATAKAEWCAVKEHDHHLFASEKGGLYGVFDERPLMPEIIKYCKQDVALLPGLYSVYNVKLWQPEQAFWQVHVRKETKAQIKLSQSFEYDGNSVSMTCEWNQRNLNQEVESWNKEIMKKAMNESYVLNEDDVWVAMSDYKQKLKDLMNWINDEEPENDNNWYDHESDQDFDGWEENMIKGSEWFSGADSYWWIFWEWHTLVSGWIICMKYRAEAFSITGTKSELAIMVLVYCGKWVNDLA